ncbi:hypothetical protein BDE02_17G081100 [Populus trichocarpa]|uniref:Rapid ALkalinization Factor n=1 Tax=Populus trichocarpa x Populus deltoides TaxID=3695 RepID=A9PJ37_9ROSI|nr:unknown [Populus trichocarpa x Populus deltoides]KAI5559016.1 hypothetical protein BDE02_17G081100 [Populus trichocarpa]
MRSLSLSALTSSSLLLMMMLNTISCSASISLPKMDGDVPLYSSVADSYMDLEFMMDSEINRILTGSRNALDALRGNQATFDCGHRVPYQDCLAQKNGGHRCGIYNRECPH